MHGRARPRPTRRFDTLIAAVALVLAFGQVVPALHLVLVPHRVCVLHGLEDVRADGAEATDAFVPPQRSDQTRFRAAPAYEASHHACFLAYVVRERAVALRDRGAEALAFEGRASSVGAISDGTPRPARRLLSLAPKQGPPV